MAWTCLVSHFSRSLQADYHCRLSCMISPCSSSDFGPSYDILDVMRMSSLRILSGKALPVMHLKVLIFIDRKVWLFPLLFQRSFKSHADFIHPYFAP